jgi:hypothetical protein
VTVQQFNNSDCAWGWPCEAETCGRRVYVGEKARIKNLHLEGDNTYPLQIGRSILTFRGNVRPTFSGSKNKPSKKVSTKQNIGLLLGLPFDLEDGYGMFFRNVRKNCSALRLHIPEDCTVYNHPRENLKSRINIWGMMQTTTHLFTLRNNIKCWDYVASKEMQQTGMQLKIGRNVEGRNRNVFLCTFPTFAWIRTRCLPNGSYTCQWCASPFDD